MAETGKSFDLKAFSRKPWVVVVLGLLLPPVGIILAWLKPDWSSRTKWIATGLLGLLLIGRYRASTAEKPEDQSGVSQVSVEKEPSGKSGDIVGRESGFASHNETVADRQEVRMAERTESFHEAAVLPAGQGHEEAQRENEARSTQMREEEKRFIQKEEAEAREQAANSMREYEEKQAVLERQQREEELRLAQQRKDHADAQQGQLKQSKTDPVTVENVRGDKKLTTAEKFPFTVTRNWFESDEKYLRPGVDLVAAKCRGAKVTKLTLQPASEPWKGFRGEVVFNNQTRANIEAHAAGNDFVVVLYGASQWLGYGADFLDASANELTSDEFCKKAYGKTPEQMLKVFQEEESRRVTAVALWNMASNEAQMQKRFSEPFQVTGEVFEVEKTYSGWHLKLVGHRKGRFADGWIDCLMKENTGVDKVLGGSTVTVEGKYKSGTTVVEMQECRIVK